MKEPVTVVVKVEPYGGSDVRQHEIYVGRELYGQRSWSPLGCRFKSRKRAVKIAAYLAAEYTKDGCNVIVIGTNGRERAISGA